MSARHNVIETDYLVVGAGAAGMAFTDDLLTHGDADVVMVDRRAHPGGHWNDAYPFVRLHQPSAFYGVNSHRLGNDTIDEVGANAGHYECATAAEICDYYQHVLEATFVGSGRVRFFGMSDYRGRGPHGHDFTSRVTGATTTVRVRRRLVDATHLEVSVPASHTPAFSVDPGASLIPPNELVRMTRPADRFTVLGAGKTAMDTCCWLLEQGVDPELIRWIRPRDPWVMDRAHFQPLDKLADSVKGISQHLHAAAHASDAEDFIRRLEECGQFIRLDPEVEPSMFHGATVNQTELAALRGVRDVVRLGRVVHLGTDEIVLENGTIPTDARQLHIDCTAAGEPRVAASRPIFESDRITLQSIRSGQVPFNAALVGFVETTSRDDREKNRLCPPNPNTDTPLDWLTSTYITHTAQQAWFEEADIMQWMEVSRVNITAKIADHLDEARMQSALRRMLVDMEPAIASLERMLSDTSMRAA